MIPQRHPNSPRIRSVRPMTTADLELLRHPSHRPRLAKIRDSHHIIARSLASGMTVNETAAQTGYTTVRISMLRSDPAMAELIANYRDKDTTQWLKSRDSYYDAATSNMLKAEAMIADTLDDAINSDEKLPLRELLALTSDRADRFGYSKKSTNVNVNVDFAKHLELARRRIDEQRQLEGTST